MRKFYVKHLIALSFIFTWLDSYAQVYNMVLNPGFEAYDDCPQGYTHTSNSHILIPDWTYPTAATPDYFNECGTGEVKVPDNFAGYSKAKSGRAYAGAILSGSNRNFREYIQGSLYSPMDSGQKYCVSFWYKLASGSKFAIDQLGLHFTTSEIINDHNTFLNLTADLTNKEGLFLDNTEEWNQFSQVYTAKGGEERFVVGNFNNYDHTNYVATGRDTKNKKGKSYAYYFFDNFDIRPIDDCNNCPGVPKGLKAEVIDSSYTGGKNPVTGQIDKIINDGIISLEISGGEPPYNIEWSNGIVNVEKIQNLEAGTYTYYVSDKNNCHTEGTVVFKEPAQPKDAFIEGLRNIEEGGALILNNIFFETAKSTLLPASFEELDKVVHFLKEGTVSLIEISGHTDEVGTDQSNQLLSQQRAEAVVKYLVSQGINPQRIKAAGYGESRFIDTNKTDVGRSKNRRVEFTVLKK